MTIPTAALRPLGDFADELLLGGQRVLPSRAQLSGFRFRHESIRSALNRIVGCRTRTLGGALTGSRLGHAATAVRVWSGKS